MTAIVGSDQYQVDSVPITLFESFPREVGKKKWWCPDKEFFDNFVRLNNGYNDCFCSIYRQTLRENIKDMGDAIDIGAVVDKIYLDFDTRFGHESMMLAHEWLDQHDIIHRVNISGRWEKTKVISTFDPTRQLFIIKRTKVPVTIGYHVYYWVNQNFVNKKSVVFNCQKSMCDYIAEKLKTGWGVEIIDDQWRVYDDGRRELIPEWELPINQMYSPVDKKVWGDLVRISRIPNTWNPKRGRYCVPLTKKMIDEATQADFCELSKKQWFFPLDKLYLGTSLFKVPKEFDTAQIDTTLCDYSTRIKFDPDPDVTRTILKGMRLPTCIKKLISITTLDYTPRFWLIVYLRERGLSEEQVNQILMDFLRPDYADHCIREEHQVSHAFNGAQQRAYMPNCYKFSKICHCEEDCQKCFRYQLRHPVYRAL